MQYLILWSHILHLCAFYYFYNIRSQLLRLLIKPKHTALPGTSCMINTI